ncbi:MAG TPA: ATP-binding protein [Gemmatimonadales bacterium]|nr:ATP-binding protein [Gemmatimonadales bacterium]
MEAKELLDSLDAGVVAIAPDWTIAAWSAGAARITGLPRERVLGQSFWVAFPAARASHIERVLQAVRDDGKPQTYLAPATATDFPGMVFETHVTCGPHNHLVMLFRQVRQELPAGERGAQLTSGLETERRLYHLLFSSLPTPALVLAVDGQILEANPEGLRLLGGSDAASLRGRPLTDWTPSAYRAPLTTALRDAVTQRQELRFTLEFAGEPPREVHAVIVNVDPVRAAPRLLFLALDVSREALLQRRLLQADRLSQLGALVSGVAHELNNPLAAIAAFGEALALDPGQADVSESAEVIRSEAMRAGRIVQTLLDFARQRPRMRTAVDLVEIADRVVALQRSAFKKARIRASVAIGKEVPAVAGDPQELQQVLLNAVVNARQAIESSGRAGQITIGAQASEHHVLMTVDDSGPGVAPEILDRVFEPFFTTKADEGTGLGLAISFGLVRGMGGRMWMQNVEGGGARLSFELPVDAEAAGQTADGRGVRSGTRRLSVFLVEDEDTVRRAMTLLAKRLGHDVTAVGRYDEATDRLGASDARYDALLVDVHLDEEHTGFDLFERLLEEGRGRERRIVFITGDSISLQTRDALQRADRPVLRKPFSLDELREMLDRVSGG